MIAKRYFLFSLLLVSAILVFGCTGPSTPVGDTEQLQAEPKQVEKKVSEPVEEPGQPQTAPKQTVTEDTPSQTMPEEEPEETVEQTTLSHEKEQAKQFALQIIQTYFDNDCDTYYNSLNDPLYRIYSEIPIDHDILTKDAICDLVSIVVRGDYDFQDYLDSYNTELLDKSEYESKYGEFKFPATDKDYLFNGLLIKTGSEVFMLDDLLIFMVRKTDDGWIISALSG